MRALLSYMVKAITSQEAVSVKTWVKDDMMVMTLKKQRVGAGSSSNKLPVEMLQILSSDKLTGRG